MQQPLKFVDIFFLFQSIFEIPTEGDKIITKFELCEKSALTTLQFENFFQRKA